MTTRILEAIKECQISDLTLNSASWAGELQGNSFGVFQYLGDGDQGPVYQQRHDGNGDGDFMFRFNFFIIVWKLKNQRSQYVCDISITNFDMLY